MQGPEIKKLLALAFMMGIPDAEGNLMSDEILDNHDWNTLLLAKDFYDSGDFLGPEWVPFSLWQRHDTNTGSVLIDSPGAKELWEAIERTFEFPNDVAISLPMEISHAKELWGLISKRNPAAHRDHYMELKARAESMAREIDRFEALEMYTTGERFDFMRLYDDDEKEIVYQNVWRHNLRMRNTGAMEVEGRRLGYKAGDFQGGSFPVSWTEYTTLENPQEQASPLNHSLASREAGQLWELLVGDDMEWPGIVPSVSPLLRRLAGFFEIEANSPALQRPAIENAERNYVTRHLCQYFQASFGIAPPSIISRIICMFYPQGITENEVSQMARRIKAESHLSTEPASRS